MDNFNKQNFIKIGKIGNYSFRHLYINIKDLKTYTKINVTEPLSPENLKETDNFKDMRGNEFLNLPTEYLDSKCEDTEYDNIKTIYIANKYEEIFCV
jgi:hypothetical protein